MLSQTSSGQVRLERVLLDLREFNLTRFMDGVLSRIFRRMRGLQSLHISLHAPWEEEIPGKPESHETSDWPERFGEGFLLLIRTELAHIKTITISHYDEDQIATWLREELEERTHCWLIPSPQYKKYCRTTTNVSYLNAEVVKAVAQDGIQYKSTFEKLSPQILKRKYGGFVRSEDALLL